MHSTPVVFSRRALKLGVKSGVLPRPRFMIKKNRVKSIQELKEDSKIEQGYADGIPTPIIRGKSYSREPKSHTAAVDAIIEQSKLEPQSVESSKMIKLQQEPWWSGLNEEEKRKHLNEVLHSKPLNHSNEEVEDRRIKKNSLDSLLPTLAAYLDGPLMRPRTAEEQARKDEQRAMNLRKSELEKTEKKYSNLLALYHAAGDFITTEEELEAAIGDAFEVNVVNFESNERMVRDKLSGNGSAYVDVKDNDRFIKDTAYGEIRGNPGLETVRDILSGESENHKKAARAELSHKA